MGLKMISLFAAGFLLAVAFLSPVHHEVVVYNDDGYIVTDRAVAGYYSNPDRTTSSSNSAVHEYIVNGRIVRMDSSTSNYYSSNNGYNSYSNSYSVDRTIVNTADYKENNHRRHKPESRERGVVREEKRVEPERKAVTPEKFSGNSNSQGESWRDLQIERKKTATVTPEVKAEVKKAPPALTEEKKEAKKNEDTTTQRKRIRSRG